MALSLNVYKRIKDLTAKTTLDDGDALVSDNASDSSSKKITFGNLCTQLLTKLKIGTLSTSGHYTSGTSVASDLSALDEELYNAETGIDGKVSDVKYTDTGILQKTVGDTDTNVMITDGTATENSVNPVQSGAMYTALTAMAGSIAEEAADIGDMTTLQTTARTLVGGINEVKNTADKAVQYTAQTLTDSQKTQTRTNISAQKELGLYIDASGDICQA